MKRLLLALSPLFVFAWCHVASAQLDSTSAVLLRPGGKAPSRQNLDSSRYKIRAPESRRDDDEIGERPGTVIPSPVTPRKPKSAPVPTTTSEVTVTAPPPTETPVPTPVPPEPVEAAATPISPVAPTAPEVVTEAEPAVKPPVTQQVRELVGGTEEDIIEAKTAIHPQDPRSNVIDIQIAPGYYYNDSSSTYSYRDYTSNGPALGLGMNVWLTPFFGFQSRYFTSVSSSVRSGGTNMIPTEVLAFDAGVRFRKHFGYSRKAAHLNWGLDYHDEMNKINKEATTIIGRKSSGLSVSFEAVMPSSFTYAHTVQVDLRPRMKHTESGTAADVKSGTKSETNAIALSVGGEWTLDRKNRLFWKSQYSVERNLFRGPASDIDPADGQTPDGVAVTNSLMMFYLGFKWGS